MKWLLWKDYRHNRLIVFAALAILLGPYLVGLCVLCGGRWFNVEWSEWRFIIGASCAYSLILSQLTFALIGGNAISGERVDRSAAFLYSLPFTRKKLLASKLLLVVTIAVVIWLTTAVVCACLVPTAEWARLWNIKKLPRLSPDFFEFLVHAGPLPITGLTFFCVAWFFSSYVASPAFDVCAGLLVPVLVISGIGLTDAAMIHWGLRVSHISGYMIALWYCGICLTLSPLCFILGTWHYLRRVEP